MNQYGGNYQEATKNYLQVLEALYQIKCNTQDAKDNSDLTFLRASLLSRLGDNLFYLGQYKIAAEFYSQQLSLLAGFGNSLNLATAHQKIGFCSYFIGLYEASILSQKQSIAILLTEEEQLSFKPLRCRIHLCIGLNQYALGNIKLAVDSYEEGMAIARLYSLPSQEAEISAYLSSSVREYINLKNDKMMLDNLIGDLQYALRIVHKNPYLKVLIFRELGKVHENLDIDISSRYFEEALNLSNLYSLSFSSILQDELDQARKRHKLDSQYYFVLEKQSWYSSVFPCIPEIEWQELESSGFKADFVIVTATSTELKAVVSLLDSDSSNSLFPCRIYTSSGQYYLGKFGHYNTVVTQSRMGDRYEFGSNSTTRKALDKWDPKAAIMVGIAFGKDEKKQNIADVLIATKLIDYESARVNSDGSTDNRGDHLLSNGQLLRLFEQSYGWQFQRPDDSLCNCITAPILSGCKLVDNPDFKAKLFSQFPDSKGGEMEGIGFANAANEKKKPWILVKAICDWADGNKHDLYQPLAAASAASLTHYVLSQRTILSSFDEA